MNRRSFLGLLASGAVAACGFVSRAAGASYPAMLGPRGQELQNILYGTIWRFETERYLTEKGKTCHRVSLIVSSVLDRESFESAYRWMREYPLPHGYKLSMRGYSASWSLVQNGFVKSIDRPSFYIVHEEV